MQSDQNKLPYSCFTILTRPGCRWKSTSRASWHSIVQCIKREGHPVTEACLENQDLPGLLQYHDPDEYILFNTCEEIPGIPHSYDLIAQTLEG